MKVGWEIQWPFYTFEIPMLYTAALRVINGDRFDVNV